jgi:hypothetical protein
MHPDERRERLEMLEKMAVAERAGRSRTIGSRGGVSIAGERCADALAKAHALLGELANDLAPILRPERPNSNAEGVEATGPSDFSETAMRISSIGAGIEELLLRLERLRLRIDL